MVAVDSGTKLLAEGIATQRGAQAECVAL